MKKHIVCTPDNRNIEILVFETIEHIRDATMAT